MDDQWSLPSTSAGHADPERDAVVDEETRRRHQFHDLLALRLLVGIPAMLVLVFSVVVGSGARAHAEDKELLTSWWAHHAAYDCCGATAAGDVGKCRPGVAALHELRSRLIEREHGPRAWLAARVADSLGLADVDVSDAPTNVAAVDRILDLCPSAR